MSFRSGISLPSYSCVILQGCQGKERKKTRGSRKILLKARPRSGLYPICPHLVNLSSIIWYKTPNKGG